MITIYERGYEDFSTMGLGQLLPTSCVVHEEQGGAYELELEHPMDEEGRHSLITPGCVLRVPAPSRPTPLVTTGGLADREIYTANEKINIYSKATTSMGTTITSTTPSLDLTSIKPSVVAVSGYTDMGGTITTTKWVSNGNRIVGTASSGAELIAVDKSNPSFYLATTRAGVSGYVQVSKITYSKTESLEEQTIQARKTREQLFRIYRIEKDTDNLSVKAWARHVYYDLLGNVLVNCVANSDTVSDALIEMTLNCTQTDHGFVFGTNDTETLITADWSLKGMVEAQLDPDEGLASLGNLRVIRDNYDVFFVKRSTTARAPITYGRTLLGVRVDINEDAVVNRIVPVGKDANGDPLMIDAVYVDSPNNDDATMLRAKTIEYDVRVGDDYPTEADAKTELTSRANADFDAGIDQPEVTVNVDFLQLGDTKEYAQYKELDRLYLGDLIRVTDLVHGVDVEAEINEYDFDCLTEHYTSIVIGVTDSMRLIGSVSGFMIPDNAVSSTKIVGGTGNADTLDGHDSTYFATADHAHDAEYLGLTAKAADADKLGGIDADDYSTTQQTNDSIKLAVTSQSANLFPSDPSSWEQGSIDEANGSLLAYTDRIRSADYITLNPGTLYTVSRVKSLTGQIFLVYYNNSNTVIGHSGSWVATYPYSFSLPSGATKMRVIVRTADNGTIVPTDVPDVLFSIVPAGVSGGVQVDAIYPVGAIYMSDVSTSPSTLFGGTWSTISNPPTGASYWWKRTA